MFVGAMSLHVAPKRLGQSDSPFQDWAILSDPECQTSGLPDLLTAELTSRSFSLLERDLSDVIGREKLMQQIFSKQGNESAVAEIGSLLNADALIVLSNESPPPVLEVAGQEVTSPSRIRISVYGCKQAVRLGYIQVDKRKAAKATSELAEWLERVRDRFPDGVDRAIGISPFAVKNLEKRYDSLGQQYHDLLSTALSSSPGVAVIDYENARQIGQELPDAKSLHQRVVPQYIEVDYRVEPGIGDEASQVKFSITNRMAVERTAIESPLMTMKEAPVWLVQQLVPKLVSRESVPTVPMAEQLAAMRERAERFDGLGDFRNAGKIRESLLLIDANDHAQRLQLLDDYRTLSAAYKLPVGLSTSLELNREAAELRQIALEHVECLIRNKHIRQEPAILLLKNWCSFDGGLRPPLLQLMHDQAFADSQDSRFEADSRFFKTIVEPFWSLGRSKEFSKYEELQLKLEWSNLVWQTLGRRIEQKYFTPKQMTRIFRAAAEAIPEGFPTHNWATLYTSASPIHVRRGSTRELQITQQWDKEFKRDSEEVLECFRSMLHEGHAHLRIYGRLGLFEAAMRKEMESLDPYRAPGDTRPIKVPDKDRILELIQEAETAIQEIAKRPDAMTRDAGFYQGFCDRVLGHYHALVRRLREKIPSPPMKSSNAEPKPRREPGFGRMQFDSIPLDLSVFQDEEFDFVPGTKKFDWLISKNKIVRMNSDLSMHLVRELPKLAAAPGRLSRVVWDGTNLIIRDRVDTKTPWEVLDHEGNLMATFDPAETFPPYEELDVLVVSPNRLCVVGRLEKNTRCWCALADYSNGSYQTHIFHEARRPMIAGRPDEELWDRDLVVFAKWAYRFEEHGKEYFLLPRDGAHPMRVELPSLRTEVVGLPTYSHLVKPLFCKGQFVFGYGLPWIYSSTNFTKEWSKGRVLVPITDYAHNEGEVSPGNYEGTAIEYEGWIYVPGYTWYRFDPTFAKYERLVPNRLTNYFGALQIRKSEVHGLVGFRNETSPFGKIEPPMIYKIKVKEKE